MIRTSIGVLRLQMPSRQAAAQVRSYVADLPSFEITCSSTPNDYPMLVTYKPTTTVSGVITSLAVVPRDFRLD
jgi:hypothetical protein